jgi:hypothetical protein
MMMSKPAPESTKEEDAPAFAVTAKKTPQSAVEDLERRLAMLGHAAADPAVVPAVVPEQQRDMKPPATTAAAAKAAAAPVKGGKNALLVSPKEGRWIRRSLIDSFIHALLACLLASLCSFDRLALWQLKNVPNRRSTNQNLLHQVTTRIC